MVGCDEGSTKSNSPRRGVEKWPLAVAFLRLGPGLFLVSRGRSPPGQKILGDEIAIPSRLQREVL
jgi:hypothetical protein